MTLDKISVELGIKSSDSTPHGTSPDSASPGADGYGKAPAENEAVWGVKAEFSLQAGDADLSLDLMAEPAESLFGTEDSLSLDLMAEPAESLFGTGDTDSLPGIANLEEAVGTMLGLPPGTESMLKAVDMALGPATETKENTTDPVDTEHPVADIAMKPDHTGSSASAELGTRPDVPSGGDAADGLAHTDTPR